jgi:GT2 family glycosyltransferase
MADDLLAVIPFYQRRDQLDRCLAALAESTHPVTPFVHDNNVENLGFTKAINLGLRAAIARGDAYALLINQDCYVEPDTVAALVRFMETHPRCAIAGPMQLVPDDPDLILSAGGVAVHPAARVRRGRRSAGHCAQSIPVVYVNGACMFVRLSAVLEFGLLDESMVLFCSDVDWSLTARARGWEAWYCAEAHVFHEKGVSDAGSANPPDVRERMDRDGDAFRRKWFGSVLYHQLDRMPGEARLAEPIDRALATAQAHVDGGRLVEAEMIYRDVLTLQPDSLAALERMAALMWTSYENASLACDYLERAVAVAPTHAELRLRYAMALDVMRRTEQAVRAYAEAARLEDSLPQRLQEIAARLSVLGRESEAATVRAKLAAMRQPGGPSSA